MNKKRYRDSVDSISKTSIKHAGLFIDSGCEVDHIFPVSYGYVMKIPTHIIGHINNLQILTKEQNLIKSNKCDTIPIFIQEYLLNITKEKLDKEFLQRQRIGIQIAKSKGTYIGRVHGSLETIEKFISKPKNKKAIELLKEGKLKKVEISRIVGIHVNTITKLSKTIKNNNPPPQTLH
jgi:hypothetical protein